jgi:hypothetical protein
MDHMTTQPDPAAAPAAGDKPCARAPWFPLIVIVLAQLRALQASFLIVGAISLLAIFPASRLPGYVPGELSAEDIISEAEPGEGPSR